MCLLHHWMMSCLASWLTIILHGVFWFYLCQQNEIPIKHCRTPRGSIGVLFCWYNKLVSCVRWHTIIWSSEFRLTYGVRQGVTFSAFLFNI